MSYFTVFAETGFPHAGTLYEYDDGTSEWIGFIPAGSVFGDPGWMDQTNKVNLIDYYMRFWIDEEILRQARNDVTAAYTYPHAYIVFVSDCVTFAEDMAEACGLNFAPRPQLTPTALVVNLANQNPMAIGPIYASGSIVNYNDRPFPFDLSNPLW
jgi:hypothetical protein